MAPEGTPFDWSTVFEEAHPVAGANDAEIALLEAELARPLSPDEIQEITRGQSNPFPESDPLHASWTPFDPTPWRIPVRPLPRAYLDFLRHSNGGAFRQGARWFDAFLATHEVRAWLLDYHLPQYVPGLVPFAMDGSGGFYLFDMRGEPDAQGEYPIRFGHASALDYDETTRIAGSFLDACRGTSDPAEPA